MSGSPIQCALCGLSNGIEMLARPAVTMLRAMLERLDGALHGVADRDRPAVGFGIDAGQARPFEPQPHHLRLVLPRQLGAADGLARIVAERLDVDRRRGVEHEPQRVGALEHRGRRLLGERKEQAQASPCRRNSTATGRLDWRATRRLLLGGLAGRGGFSLRRGARRIRLRFGPGFGFSVLVLGVLNFGVPRRRVLGRNGVGRGNAGERTADGGGGLR